jgi:hypothetical protein
VTVGAGPLKRWISFTKGNVLIPHTPSVFIFQTSFTFIFCTEPVLRIFEIEIFRHFISSSLRSLVVVVVILENILLHRQLPRLLSFSLLTDGKIISAHKLKILASKVGCRLIIVWWSLHWICLSWPCLVGLNLMVSRSLQSTVSQQFILKIDAIELFDLLIHSHDFIVRLLAIITCVHFKI